MVGELRRVLGDHPADQRRDRLRRPRRRTSRDRASGTAWRPLQRLEAPDRLAVAEHRHRHPFDGRRGRCGRHRRRRPARPSARRPGGRHRCRRRSCRRPRGRRRTPPAITPAAPSFAISVGTRLHPQRDVARRTTDQFGMRASSPGRPTEPGSATSRRTLRPVRGARTRGSARRSRRRRRVDHRAERLRCPTVIAACTGWSGSR